MKKNSCTPINPKKYSCNGLNKIHAKNLITKKNSCSSKIPLPLPHNFSNGPSLKRELGNGVVKIILTLSLLSVKNIKGIKRATIKFINTSEFKI